MNALFICLCQRRSIIIVSVQVNEVHQFNVDETAYKINCIHFNNMHNIPLAQKLLLIRLEKGSIPKTDYKRTAKN